MATIELKHSIDAAHRVYGHEGGKGKCARLHGHTYSVVVQASCDPVFFTREGFVVDFAVLKRIIDAWDHRTVLWSEDPLCVGLLYGDDLVVPDEQSVVRVPFNPTSENMSDYLAGQVMDAMISQGASSGAVYVSVSETPKSKAEARRNW